MIHKTATADSRRKGKILASKHFYSIKIFWNLPLLLLLLLLPPCVRSRSGVNFFWGPVAPPSVAFGSGPEAAHRKRTDDAKRFWWPAAGVIVVFVVAGVLTMCVVMLATDCRRCYRFHTDVASSRPHRHSMLSGAWFS